MDEIYAYLYEQYSAFYINHVPGEAVSIPAQAVCNHKQIDMILRSFDEDEDIIPVLECMRSCVGCIGNDVPALHD